METYKIKPVAFVYNKRPQIDDDFWGNIESEIRLADNIPESALTGLTEFSHIEIIYYFHKLKDDLTDYEETHPRGILSYPKCGVFAQRKKLRPNKLAITISEIIRQDGKSIFVKGLDAIDGTPVIDIKPVIKEFLPQTEIRQPEWVSDLMKDYWK